MWPENCKPFGDHFIANIVQPQMQRKSSLAVVNPDPRKARRKPDAYPAFVEECGSRCELVKPGDHVVVERWEWQQHNVDSERIVTCERDLLILHNSVPAPGVIVVDVIEDGVPATGLMLPDTYKPKSRGYVHGRIRSSAHYRFRVGWEIWFEKFDRGQYRFGESTIIFRVDESMTLAVREPEPMLEVV